MIPAARSLRPADAIAFLWGVAEATLFFIVPDVAIAWLALRRGLAAGLRAGLFAAIGAALGGLAVYAWSAADPEEAAALIEAVPAIPSGAVSEADAALRETGFPAALFGAFQGEPYKVWSAAAPHAGWAPFAWGVAAFPIRLPRFILVAAAFAALGALFRDRLRPALVRSLFVAGWTVFYAAYWLAARW